MFFVHASGGAMSKTEAVLTSAIPITGAGPTNMTQSHPVSPELVHRARPADAFPHGWRQRDEHTFSVTAHWPHDHVFFEPVAGDLHDPLLVVETMRQSAMLIVHAGYGVPLDWHFMLTELEYSANPIQLDVGGQPALIDVELEFSRLEWRGGKLSRLKVGWVLRRLGRLVATGSGQARVLSPGVYRRLRGDRTVPGDTTGYLPLPVPADLAGRTRAHDVVLSPCPQERVWRLRVDTSHPTLFQRPNDHVPGMLLLESARQAASAALGPAPFVPVGGDITFHRYAEFDSPCWIQVTDAAPRRPGMTSVQVTGHQDDSLVFLATLSAPRAD